MCELHHFCDFSNSASNMEISAQSKDFRSLFYCLTVRFFIYRDDWTVKHCCGVRLGKEDKSSSKKCEEVSLLMGSSSDGAATVYVGPCGLST